MTSQRVQRLYRPRLEELVSAIRLENQYNECQSKLTQQQTSNQKCAQQISTINTQQQELNSLRSQISKVSQQSLACVGDRERQKLEIAQLRDNDQKQKTALGQIDRANKDQIARISTEFTAQIEKLNTEKQQLKQQLNSQKAVLSQKEKDELSRDYTEKLNQLQSDLDTKIETLTKKNKELELENRRCTARAMLAEDKAKDKYDKKLEAEKTKAREEGRAEAEANLKPWIDKIQKIKEIESALSEAKSEINVCDVKLKEIEGKFDSKLKEKFDSILPEFDALTKRLLDDVIQHLHDFLTDNRIITLAGRYNNQLKPLRDLQSKLTLIRDSGTVQQELHRNYPDTEEDQ